MARGWRWVCAAGVVAGTLAVSGGEAWTQGVPEARTVAMAAASRPEARTGEPGETAAGIERVGAAAPAEEDPCRAPVVSQPSRPMWTAGAQPTQCGVMENDLGWRWQGLGGGIHQQGFTSTERYGITRWLDLSWSLPTRLDEAGEGEDPLSGISDQSVSVMWEFLGQRRRLPAMAVSYGVKIPTANPAKGFGSGRVDHALAFLASRDVGRVHLDFNVASTLEGEEEGFEGAAQAGLVMAVPVWRNLAWLIETDGGPQPETAERFGQSLTGFSWALRPNLVVDAAYTQAWTAGTPRKQFTTGVTWAHRLPSVPRLSQWLTR